MKTPTAVVDAIFADLTETNGKEQQRIADKHQVSRSTVSDIWCGRRHGRRNKSMAKSKEPVEKPDPTSAKIAELESDNVHLRDELNYERRKLKAGARQKGLFAAIVEEMDGRITPFRPLPRAKKPKTKSNITEHAVMHLSDMHADQIVVPSECGGLEEYNFPIACARAERYVETVIEWTQDTLSPKFDFPSLTILSYGDHTSGEIHGHTQRSYYRNQFKNCFAVGQLQAMMFRDLAPHFKEVNVICIPGNHGRRTAKKDHHGAHDNFDYLIAEIARMHCADLDNVNFTIPNSWSINVDINGVGFNVSHGDDVRGWSGIPFYGMVRRQKGLIALGAHQGRRVRYFVMGHHHVAASMADVDGELLVNGAWTGTDAYAYNTFSGYREPCQWFHGVNPKHGITWRLNVKLKRDGEQQGPKRYKVEL